MFCNNCGNQVDDNAVVCPYCGVQLAANAAPQQPQPAYDQQNAQPQYQQPAYQQPQYQQPVYQQPQYGAQAPMEDPQERAMSKSALIWGILGIAFASSFYLSILGIIFSAIGLSKAKKYVAAGYPLTGRAKVGRILSIIGLILAIVMTVIFVIYIIVAVIAAAAYSSSYYYYY